MVDVAAAGVAETTVSIHREALTATTRESRPAASPGDRRSEPQVRIDGPAVLSHTSAVASSRDKRSTRGVRHRTTQADPAADTSQARRRTERRRRVLRGALAPDRRWWALAVLTVMLSTLGALAPAFLGMLVIDDILGPGDLSTLDQLTVALVVVVVLIGLTTWASAFLVPWLGQRALLRLRLRSFERLLTVPVAYFDRQSTGRLISRLTNNIELLTTLVQGGLTSVISSFALLVAVGVAFLVIDPQLALIAYLSIPVLLTLVWALHRVQRWATRRTIAGIGELTSFLRETIRGAATVRAYGAQDRHRQRFHELNDLERSALARAAFVFGAFSVATQLVVSLDAALLVFVGGRAALTGAISVGTMVVFITYLDVGVRPISTMATLQAAYGQSSVALDQLAAMAALQPDRDGTHTPTGVSPGTSAVCLSGVWFAYDARGWVLEDLTLDLAAGEHLAIVGATGVGKSSIIRLILRLYRPVRGQVELFGHDVQGVTNAWLRQQVAVVAQEPVIFRASLAENIAFGHPDAGPHEVRSVIDRLDLDEVLVGSIGGLDRTIGDGTTPISEGQRQLVGCARAMLADRPLLLLDEATSGLDRDLANRVTSAFGRLRVGRSTVTVAHDLTIAATADRIALLADHAATEVGTHEELLAAGGRYSDMWRAHHHLQSSGPHPSPGDHPLS